MTQVNLAEIDKVSFYNQKEWLEEYESGKGIFIMNTLMMRTVRVVKITIATRRKVQVKKMKALTLKRRRYSMHIAVLSYFY